MRKILEENKELKQDIESLQNAVVRNQNKIDELTNVIWLFVNKGVNLGEFKNEIGWDKFDYGFYLCNYRHFSLEELTKEEYDLVSKEQWK
jgi:hypothetical protein